MLALVMSESILRKVYEFHADSFGVNTISEDFHLKLKDMLEWLEFTKNDQPNSQKKTKLLKSSDFGQ